MSTNDHFVLGDYNAVCFECGRKKKFSTLKRHWQGYYVCPDHWETRHPQDFARDSPTQSQPEWTQPPGDVFIDDGNPVAVPFDPNNPGN